LPIGLIACGALYSQTAPISHLIVGKTLGIRTAKDLAGKTLAVSTLRDMIQVTVLQWIDKNGGDSKAVNFTEIPPAQQASAIVAHRIDGSALVEPFYARARADVEAIGNNYEAVADGKPFQTLGIVGNASWLSQNGATARKLAEALHEAARWANHNHDDAARLLATFTKIDLAVIQTIPRLLFAESNNPGYVQPVIDMMARYNVLGKTFAATELFVPGVA
jgi:NitT/TauT family transport system substrate-binding protein